MYASELIPYHVLSSQDMYNTWDRAVVGTVRSATVSFVYEDKRSAP